ncbi:hypothetical protein B0T24DRAFT_664936 [Lasiosphaeria ovina]|uniref:Uncharacterized protein n=1 Tax=Lasiosphaeria ovina TaxID=92902 RepID=A0AAE0KH17_9PEZI|nr:hypothetical protein B0T24DRAFT_664936 [Lasiosphaeria ovina]
MFETACAALFAFSSGWPTRLRPVAYIHVKPSLKKTGSVLLSFGSDSSKDIILPSIEEVAAATAEYHKKVEERNLALSKAMTKHPNTGIAPSPARPPAATTGQPPRPAAHPTATAIQPNRIPVPPSMRLEKPTPVKYEKNQCSIHLENNQFVLHDDSGSFSTRMEASRLEGLEGIIERKDDKYIIKVEDFDNTVEIKLGGTATLAIFSVVWD